MSSEEKERDVTQEEHTYTGGFSKESSGSQYEPASYDAAMELPEIPRESMGNMPILLMEPEAQKPPEPRKRSGWKLFAAAVALVAMGAGMGSATTWFMARKFAPMPPIGLVAPDSSGMKKVSQTLVEAGNVIPGIYRQVGPAVVSIKVQANRGWTRGQSTGSGFVVDPRGHILTNHHVIDGATRISVHFVDGTVLEGSVVGSDKFKDLAVVKVDPGNRGLVAAPLGDSDAVQVGELAIAIGSPFSQDHSVTAGIVSGLNRDLREENSSWVIPGAIQTDAAINPGNSGGPLLNASGQVIGINTAIESPTRGSVGIGFAVPINAAKEILPTLIAGQKVQYAWLGVGLNNLTPAVAEQIGTDLTEGAVIVDVYPNSPAEKAGIKPAGLTRQGAIVSADIVTKVDEHLVKNADDLVKYLGAKKPDDTVVLTLVRAGKQLTITAKLAARPDQISPKDDE